VRRDNGAGLLRIACVAALGSLAGCAAPSPKPQLSSQPVLDAAALGIEPGMDHARAREEERRGIGIPPAQPGPRTVDLLPGNLRAARPASGTGPGVAPWSGAPANALSRLSALPASPLANPPGGFTLGRP
jgi:hypothetical protein